MQGPLAGTDSVGRRTCFRAASKLNGLATGTRLWRGHIVLSFGHPVMEKYYAEKGEEKIYKDVARKEGLSYR